MRRALGSAGASPPVAGVPPVDVEESATLSFPSAPTCLIFTAMDNKAIAGILYETADLLEIDGQDSFRIRSYRNAAEAI